MSRGVKSPWSKRAGAAARRLLALLGPARPLAVVCRAAVETATGQRLAAALRAATAGRLAQESKKIFGFLLKSVDGSTDDGTIDLSAMPLTAQGAPP